MTTTSHEEDSGTNCISVALPDPVPVGGQMLIAATVMLFADPADPDCDIWPGKVRSVEQRHDRLDVRFQSGEVATVSASRAYVSVLQEADPDEALAFWREDVWTPLMGTLE